MSESWPISESLPCGNPHCSQRFESPQDVVEHLNDIYSTCAPFPTLPQVGEASEFDGYQQEYYAQPEAQEPSSVQTNPLGRWAKYHPKSGWLYGESDNTLQQLDQDQFAHRRIHNPYYPFADQDEWKLAKFINETMTLTQADQFLKLGWVRKMGFSVKNAQTLRSWFENLPKGPQWKQDKIDTFGYPTTKPVHLYWRDGFEVAKWIFGNPVFANHMAYDPVRITLDEQGREREYTEYMTGEHAWKVQDQLPEGATQMGMIFGSDKTPVSLGTGGLEMHPLFVTLANISSDVRMKATSHAWACVAFLPVVTFQVHDDYQGILKARLWHRCLEIITKTLRVVACDGGYAADPTGHRRHVFTPLVAWTADLPEQQLLACVAKNSSPVSTATTKEFGDPQPHPTRHGSDTLKALNEISKRVNVWDLAEYQKECKKIGLLGVNKPFWDDWVLSDPGVFLVPELLHTLHKFFFDHILVWCKEIIGKQELDARFRALHKRVGIRHFSNGMCHVQQMTGREHRELQRSIVAVITGIAPPSFVRVVRAMIDFIYQAQTPRLTTSSLKEMRESLTEFHKLKSFVSEGGGRTGKKGPIEHFNIPKLELMQHFVRAALALGNLIQHTADVTERLLITHCKDRVMSTNHGPGFEAQIVRDLDRREKSRVFDLYTLLRSSGSSLINAISSEQNQVVGLHPESAWIARILPGEERQLAGPRPMRNLFNAGFVSADEMRAYRVKISPDISSVSIAGATNNYGLPNLAPILNQQLPGPYFELRVWYSFKIQHYSVHNANTAMPAQTVQAYPPGAKGDEALCDAIIFDSHTGPRVAQVRLIFQLVAQDPTTIPASLSGTLAYIEPFVFAGSHRTNAGDIAKEPDSKMYLLQRELVPCYQQSSRAGLIVRLEDISHVVDIVPVFGHEIDPNLTTYNSLNLPTSFLLNDHGDKEMYTVLSKLFG